MLFLRASTLLLVALLIAAPAARPQPPPEAPPPAGEPRFGEEITVAISSLVVRVLDDEGRPVTGLTPRDFRVRVKGREVAVAAVDWVATAVPPPPFLPAPQAPPRAAPLPEPAEPGQLVVVFVQADLNPTRLKGHMVMLPLAEKLIASLRPEDRVAVVSFDSHLKLRLDFTRDRGAVRQALSDSIRFGGGAQAGRSHDPDSFAAHFDVDQAKRAASPERALQVTAEALRALPGEKVMIYLGWGLGRYGAEGVHMTPDYAPAVTALGAARASVFVLDVTDADYHSLEVGLRSVAAATGGTYSKTNLFPEQATKLLAGPLSGYYVLTLDRAALPAGGGATVLVRPVSL
jgi:VWFA-related protein